MSRPLFAARYWIPALVLSLLSSFGAASAQLDVGSDGSDGAFNPPASNIEIDLGLAPTVSSWTVPGSGNGVYDPTLWAVVFKYSSVNIPAGAQIRFKNHPSRAPVIWLVDGQVTIAGKVSVSGQHAAYHTGEYLQTPAANYAVLAEPGPGGFRGGRGSENTLGSAWSTSSGFGPGGGWQEQNAVAGQAYWGSGASHVVGGESPNEPPAPTYGNMAISQLIGGSGGSAFRRDQTNTSAPSGGAGGGALLVASDGAISVSGQILAMGGAGWNGWSGAGSGGAVRLVANSIVVSGSIRADANASGFDGSHGRVRLECNSLTMTGFTVPGSGPGYSDGVPGVVIPSSFPTLRISRVASSLVSIDPDAGLGTGDTTADINLPASGPVVVEIVAKDVPASWTVYVRVTCAEGPAREYEAPPLVPTGNPSEYSTSVLVDLIDGYTALQARARQP